MASRAVQFCFTLIFNMLMLTYGTQEWMGNEKYCKLTDGSIRRFKYPELLRNHFRYQHLIDDHNSKRHQPISLEVVWATQEWSRRPFAFLLAVTEVNVKLASEHFGGREDKGMIAFCKQFAWELLNNDYFKREAAEPNSSAHQHKEMDHVLIALPCGKKIVAQKWWFPSRPIHRHHVLDAMQRQDLIASVLQGLTIVNTASLNIVETVIIVFEL